MILSKEARVRFDYLVKEYSIPRREWDTLEIGVFYLFEWRKIAAEKIAGDIEEEVKDEAHKGTPRRSPKLSYMQKCWENWERVASDYGMHSLGQKRIGAVTKKDPKESTKRGNKKTNLRGGPKMVSI